MNSTNIKETMDQINIPEDMQKKIIKNLCKQTVDGKYRYKYTAKNFKKKLLTAAAFLLIIGTVSIPVQAGIRYLVKQRMESVPKEEIKAILEIQQSQTASADSFSREYTQAERDRMAELFRAYQNGTFPEGELLMLETDAKIPKDTLCYGKDTGRFYFPDRSLTDEELLQIIDFNYKRDYSLALDPEVQAARDEQEKEQEAIKSKIQTQGSISESEAIEIAQKWMTSFFGTSTDGMEETIYLDDGRFDVPIYHITYDIQSNCYYYFSISTIDGAIMSLDVSFASWLDAPVVSETQAKTQIFENYQTAQSFLREQMGIYEDFANVYCLYLTESGNVISRDFAYYFVTADQKVYEVSFICNTNEFSCYTQTSYESLQQTLEREKVTSITLYPENSNNG